MARSGYDSTRFSPPTNGTSSPPPLRPAPAQAPQPVVIGRHAGPTERASEPRQDGLRWLLGPAHRSELLRRPGGAPGGRSDGSLPGRSQGPPPIADRPGTDRAGQVTSSGRRAPGHPCTSAGPAPPREAGLGLLPAASRARTLCGRFGRLRTLRFFGASEASKSTIAGNCASCGRFGRLPLYRGVKKGGGVPI